MTERAQATVAPPFDAGQLAAQIGTDVYTSQTNATEILVQAECDQATLEQALASYVYDRYWDDPEGKRLAAVLQTLRQWADDAEALASDMQATNRSLTPSEQRTVVVRLGRLCDGLADIISRWNIV